MTAFAISPATYRKNCLAARHPRSVSINSIQPTPSNAYRPFVAKGRRHRHLHQSVKAQNEKGRIQKSRKFPAPLQRLLSPPSNAPNLKQAARMQSRPKKRRNGEKIFAAFFLACLLSFFLCSSMND
jgi:hypothetical protein